MGKVRMKHIEQKRFKALGQRGKKKKKKSYAAYSGVSELSHDPEIRERCFPYLEARQVLSW